MNVSFDPRNTLSFSGEVQDLVILVGQNLRGSHAVVARTDDNRIIFFSHISLQHLQGA